MKQNLLIEASAGTGKTQALAEHLISLVRQNVKPQEIVALTFSRAAAGEIFERFVTLLAKSAQKNQKDLALLREVIATQHLSQIGTLDSFLMRIVRSFPLELGLMGPLELLNDYEAGAERARVSFSILRRTDAALKRAFDEAFMLVMNHENVRSFTAAYRDFIKAWHKRFLEYPDPRAWGDATQISAASASWTTNVADLKKASDALVGLVDSDAWTEFVAWVRDFRGSLSATKGFAKKFIEQGENLFQGAAIEISYRRAYQFGGADAQAIRRAMSAVYGFVMRQKLEMARGIWTLLNAFEADYAKKVRSLGRLIFDDIPRLILALDENARLALEYRLDAKIRAWALDEFQDTSREQWKALSGLIEEAKQSNGEKSVFLVGDRKQAIYGWRNGDVSIFTHERESGAYEVQERKQSWRSGQPIMDAINAIFVNGRLCEEFPSWKAPQHETAKPQLGGFVQVVESGGTSMDDFVEPVLNALKAVDPVRRGISAAVLVRNNNFGEFLERELKRGGLKGVQWEGESNILDTPALIAFMDTLALSDHPGDRQAYEHFRRSHLAHAKYGAEIPDASTLSLEFSVAFATKGLVRTFRELRACLPEDPSCAWSEFTESRFTDMLRAAAEFERALQPGVRLSDFVTYLHAQTKRNVAEPGTIKIMTIHHAKGLGFDYVVLPLYEYRAIDTEPKGPLIGPNWLLPDPGNSVTQVMEGLREAWALRKDRSEQEELCAYYVAMTRAKCALTLVLQAPPKEATTQRMSQFVREAIPASIGDPAWYTKFVPENPKPSDKQPTTPPSLVSAPRQTIRRRLPSKSFQSGQSAGSLFLNLNVRAQALAKGVALHAEYEQIEWLEAADATNDFERALVRPDPNATLWRERAFEVFADGVWTSGRFDRVVFTKDEAIIYDFKTNARTSKESEAEFAARMTTTYHGQMMVYRKALAALTGISESKISTVLLLTATNAAIHVE